MQLMPVSLKLDKWVSWVLLEDSVFVVNGSVLNKKAVRF